MTCALVKQKKNWSLLTIAGIFASKWNMKFNASKSKVMVIGKRLDKNKILLETLL
jgi:hypothetical protein